MFNFSCDKNLQNFNLTIYDRWGELIFQTHETTDSWDGKYKNVQIIEGVYVYSIRGVYSNNAIFHKTGIIILIK